MDPEGHSWWQHEVFYEIYPRSYADSDDDGIGDLNGILSKLDYLDELGIDAIWITPFFPSPQADFGYDVSDYKDIDPIFGTLNDFDRLQTEAKNRDIRIILDLVMNHTSDQHRWFLDSRSSQEAFHRDWYIWRDGEGTDEPPNNWLSIFGRSAWQFDLETNQYYYHYFFPQQPDLNWRNPAVEMAMLDITHWWYQRGVAGFRLDAVDALFEDPNLHNNPILPGTNVYGDPNMENKYNTKLPEIHDVLRRFRTVADEHNAVLIGETWTSNIEELRRYYGKYFDEIQMPMNFMFATVNKLSPEEFRKQIATIEGSGGWPVYFLNNHDLVRSYVRYGDGQNNDAIAKLMAGLYLTLRGTPILYYGEEIGMTNNDPQRKEDVQDPIGKIGWPQQKGRDGERTPMQWNSETNAGFTRGKPWLPIPPSYQTHNVASELKNPDSILNFYKRLLALRRQSQALLDGEYIPLNQDDPNVISYLRKYNNEAVLVVINMSDQLQKVSFDLSMQGYFEPKIKTLLTTLFQPPKEGVLSSLGMEALGVYIAKLSH